MKYQHIDSSGRKRWYKNGLVHREDGPAIEGKDGFKVWLINGKFHRLDGPARIYEGVFKEWWHDGEYIEVKSQEEFEREIKLKLFW